MLKLGLDGEEVRKEGEFGPEDATQDGSADGEGESTVEWLRSALRYDGGMDEGPAVLLLLLLPASVEVLEVELVANGAEDHGGCMADMPLLSRVTIQSHASTG